jgi:hypothetical protein
MSLLQIETTRTIFLNAVMLFLVSIEPYLLSLVTSGSSQLPGFGVLAFASQIYALDLAGLTFILGLFSHLLTRQQRSLAKPELVDKYWRFEYSVPWAGHICNQRNSHFLVMEDSGNTYTSLLLVCCYDFHVGKSHDPQIEMHATLFMSSRVKRSRGTTGRILVGAPRIRPRVGIRKCA